MNPKLLKRILLGIFIIPVLGLSAILFIVHARQDAIVQSQITTLNSYYKGEISVGDVHLDPFTNFPDISLKVDDVAVYESKNAETTVILDVADIYIGFNIWDLLVGYYDIHSLKIENGFFDLVLHSDGKTNLENALASPSENKSEQPIDIHLKRIELKNIDIHKREEVTNLDIETLIYWAKGGINTGKDQIAAHIDSEFELNIMDDGDTTYVNQKHFELHTDLVFDETNGLLRLKPSGLSMEHGEFQLEGSIETRNEMTIDISVKGTKPNFDMFIAFAPKELIPVLERYDNAGEIYFTASLQGPTTNGRQPFINVAFGADEAFLENSSVKKRIDKMGFVGHFTNGEERNLKTTEFSLTDITANIEKGKFTGNLQVKNFEAPEIDMQLDLDFDIPFIVGFLNLTEVEDAKGSVEMKLKFHDIIDLENPEKVLSELNKAYFSELRIEDLSFSMKELPFPLKDLDAHLEINGRQAQLDKFNLLLGNSNISITASLSDLPAILHRKETLVKAHLEIESKVLDLSELTNYSTEDSIGIDERIENLSLAFSFEALGNAFTEYEYLPEGEFFIDNLYADLKHYPHSLHDFHADVLITADDLKIVDFSGQMDESDFHINGLIHDYGFWMQDELNGDVDFDISLKSSLLKFDNLFTYQGINYVPEDYRHEEIDGLELHAESSLHYKNDALYSVDVQLDKLQGKMRIHSLRLENFMGQFHYEDEHLMVNDFTGQMGRTQFHIDMNYYIGGNDSIKKRDNSFALKSDYIDFNTLSNYNDKVDKESELESIANRTKTDVAAHSEVFNLYKLPFTDMQFNVDIGHFIYHRLDFKDITGQLRTTQNHYIYIDTISLDAAGGQIAMNGYFNGSDPEHIYLKPILKITGVDLDKLLFKFENFGQDAVVSENLHGELTALITGNIRVYPDFVPDLDQSEVHLDAQVLKGRLENYDPLLTLTDYFGEKDLANIKFDTLQNHMDFINGEMTIPNMTIESTLGHMDISGTQNMDNKIDYYVRIPWKLVKKAAANKVFGTKERDPQAEDEIIEVDTKKKIKYLNLNISGTFDDYSIKMGKAKK